MPAARFWMFAAVFAASVARVRAAEVILPGTYREVSAITGQVLALGNELVIARDGTRQRRFSLNAIRPSDQNSGYIGGTLLPGKGSQTWTSTQRSTRCRLRFTPLIGGKLRVTQDVGFGDCGFGYGVLASGTFARTRATGKLGPWNGP